MFEQAVQSLDRIFKEKQICESHGIQHAINVMTHAENACKHVSGLSQMQITAVKFAGLLHDADDKKFFPFNHHYENLRQVLSECFPLSAELIGHDSIVLTSVPDSLSNLVIQMVELVSASKNGDRIPLGIPDWMLIPRYADRLEAIGKIGIERCWKYTRTSKRPLFLPTTIQCRNEQEIWELAATPEQYALYTGGSESMIDHYYQKLLHIAKRDMGNPYLDNIRKFRQASMIKFVLAFGSGHITSDADILTFLHTQINEV